MELLIEKAKNIIIQGRIQKDTKISWTVDNEIVLRKKEKSFSYLSCSCLSCTFSNNKSLCHRKISTILFEAQDYRLKKLIRENLELAEQHKKFDMKIEPDILICLLNDLRSFI